MLTKWAEWLNGWKHINQQVAANICKEYVDNLHMCINISGSAMVEYLIKSQQCAMSHNLDLFSVLSKAYTNLTLKSEDAMG